MRSFSPLTPIVAAPLALVASIVALGCDRPPPAEGLAEWTAADHDRAEELARPKTAPSPASSAGPKAAPKAAPESKGAEAGARGK